MRLLSALVAAIVLLVVMPVSAQVTFTQGVYEFESYIGSMTYNGTWSTVTSGVNYRTTSTALSYVTFDVEGSTLLIWRAVSSTTAHRMSVCLNVTCQFISNGAAANTGWQAFALPLPAGVTTVWIQHDNGALLLDKFMVLSDPSSSFPTAIPTATILPSSTPASTTTPQPTPTPQPTATPYTIPGVVFAIDPAKSYGSIDGQITAVEYSASAADVHTANLLVLLILSVWGFFIFAVFVLVRFKR